MIVSSVYYSRNLFISSGYAGLFASWESLDDVDSAHDQVEDPEVRRGAPEALVLHNNPGGRRAHKVAHSKRRQPDPCGNDNRLIK